MTIEAAVESQTTQLSAQEQEDEEGFAAAFESAPATEAAPDTDPAAGPDEGAQPEAPAPKPLMVFGMPEEEWNAAVAKAAQPLLAKQEAEIRKNFGQIGDTNRVLKDIQGRLAAADSSRRKITAEVFKRTNEELPGLGESLAADLAEILGSPSIAAAAASAQATAEARGQTFDADAFFQTKIGPALAQVEARAELRIVHTMHRDFDAVVKSDDFVNWLSTLPADEQKRIRESEDGFVAADAVTDYKAARKYKPATTRNKNRLENAIPAQGDGSGTSHLPEDEETQLAKGFASVK